MTRRQKMLGILVLVIMAIPAKAGWIGNFGRRLVEGARNAAQNNVQNKINKTIDNAMDGKINTNNSKGKRDYNIDSPQTRVGQTLNMKRLIHRECWI